jgi:carbon-monoxide dehydrogenase large subunit
MDHIAYRLKMDPVEVRRGNFIPPDAFPYDTPTGLQYDSGDYEKALDLALELAEYDQLREEQKQLRDQGELMGIGVSTTTEICGFGPAATLAGLGGYESATVRFHPGGEVTVFTGASPHGQGEETAFAQLVADDLGITMDNIEVVHGDTDRVPRGVGTLGSRSLVVGGTSILYADSIIKDKARPIAAALLGVGPERVVLENGQWMVEDLQDRSVSWAQVAAEAYDGRKLPPEVERGLEATYFWEPPALTFPFSAHVCVVRIDKATGEVKVTKYVSVDDCGNVVNPMLAHGQIHGGLAQGIGQALLEEAVYDENGGLISGSLMDYALPLADTCPSFIVENTVTPTPHNPMGAKGIGELGTIAATPTVVSAVTDALLHLGVTHVDIPLKSEKIWRILRERQQV